MAILEFFAGLWSAVIGVGKSIYGTSHPTTPAKTISFYNTLSRSQVSFSPLQPGVVKMYHCGPTVYGRQHIGNLSMFVFTDILRRTIEYAGYRVRQVINITDVGHLTSDADDGDDKMMKGLKQEKLKPTLENMKVLAEKYTRIFLEDLATLNIRTEGTQFPRASEHIPAQIAMIKTLEEKGYAYAGEKSVYFDTTRFSSYGSLGNINLEGQKEGARVAANDEKRHPTDFVLWKKNSKMGWDSPWGKGFPGWHIECSAMIRAILGEQIDIHTGGIEHIPVHHNNEIAQSESATGKKPFARFWLHRAHLQLEGGKMAKSIGNIVYLSDIHAKKFHPMSFRFLLLGAHYRQSASFSWDALEAAQTAFLKLRKLVDTLPDSGNVPLDYKKKFEARMYDDLDTAGALAIVWEMVKDQDLAPKNLRAGLIDFDSVLGLGLEKPDDNARKLWEKELGVEILSSDIPTEMQELLLKREAARAEKNWTEADEYRSQIETAGFVIEDTTEGARVIKK